MAKEMNCCNYYPGDVTIISKVALANLLARHQWHKVRIDNMWFGGIDDNQRETGGLHYLYPNDALLGGK